MNRSTSGHAMQFKLFSDSAPPPTRNTIRLASATPSHDRRTTTGRLLFAYRRCPLE